METRGDGQYRPHMWDAPLSGVQVTDDLSGPGGIDATITPEHARLKGLTRSMLQPWKSVLVSELDGQIKGVGIVENVTVEGPNLGLTAVGVPGYLTDMPYLEDHQHIDVDPLDMVRKIWSHVQAQAGSNLGVRVDSTRSPVRIGEEVREVEFTTSEGEDVEFEAGPYTLAWWKTDNLAKEVDDLAKRCPFDYRIEHKWRGEGIDSFLRLGYPRLGGRKDSRFVVGENVTVAPKIDYEGVEYASEALVLGAGEGRKMRRGQAARATDRLRRCAIVVDKTATSNAQANRTAERQVASRVGDPDISELVVRDHPNTRIGSWQVGDEIYVQTPDGWDAAGGMWVRVLAQRWDIDAGTVTLTVLRAGKEVRQ